MRGRTKIQNKERLHMQLGLGFDGMKIWEREREIGSGFKSSERGWGRNAQMKKGLGLKKLAEKYNTQRYEFDFILYDSHLPYFLSQFLVFSFAKWLGICFLWCILLFISCEVMSDSLWPHEQQHARLPCPSPSPWVGSKSCLLSQWLHPTISSCCPLLLPIFSSIRVFSSLHQVAKVVELQLQHQSLQWIFRIDFLYDWLVWSLCNLRDSQESSPTPWFKRINSSVLSFLYGTTHIHTQLLEKP